MARYKSQHDAGHCSGNAEHEARQLVVEPQARSAIGRHERRYHTEHDQLHGNAREGQQMGHGRKSVTGRGQMHHGADGAHHNEHQRDARRPERDRRRLAESAGHARESEAASAAPREH